MKKLLLKTLKKRGYQVFKEGKTDRNSIVLLKVLNTFSINTIFDVGANAGQYATWLRSLGFKEQIYSFEPIKEVFDRLNSAANGDEKWDTFNYALGSVNEEKIINVSKNTVSSSILDISGQHISNEPNSVYVRQEKIGVKTIDKFFKYQSIENKNILLKIDVQGFEKEVIKGIGTNLSKIAVIQVELSLIQLYKNAPSYLEMMTFLEDKGFILYNLIPVFTDYSNGRLLQFDGIFIKGNLV